jgi:hypothetical protein
VVEATQRQPYIVLFSQVLEVSDSSAVKRLRKSQGLGGRFADEIKGLRQEDHVGSFLRGALNQLRGLRDIALNYKYL